MLLHAAGLSSVFDKTLCVLIIVAGGLRRLSGGHPFCADRSECSLMQPDADQHRIRAASNKNRLEHRK